MPVNRRFISLLKKQNFNIKHIDAVNPPPGDWLTFRDTWMSAILHSDKATAAMYDELRLSGDMAKLHDEYSYRIGLGAFSAEWDGTGERSFHQTTFQTYITRSYVSYTAMEALVVANEIEEMVG